MSNITKTLIRGLRCDKKGCAVEYVGDWTEGEMHGRDWLMLDAAKHGWTFWVNRSRYDFCPDHEPAAKSNLRQIPPKTWGPRPATRASVTYLT